ncbi:MAG: ATP-binding protein [Syntrophales bacterium]
MPARKTKLFLHLKKWLEKAALDYSMIEPGDRILVGVSGGADSISLLDLLNTSMLHVTSDFQLLAVHVDLGFPNSDEDAGVIEGHLRETGVPFIIERTDIGPLAHSETNRKNPCFLCSRLRRRRLFEIAGEKGCNKVALAHHRDDIIETLMINILFGREISTMVPNQSIFRGKIRIIRPLAYIREELLKKYSREQGFPLTAGRCPTGTVSKRAVVKRLIRDLEKENGKVRENIFKALYHVKPDYLLGHGLKAPGTGLKGRADNIGAE